MIEGQRFRGGRPDGEIWAANQDVLETPASKGLLRKHRRRLVNPEGVEQITVDCCSDGSFRH